MKIERKTITLVATKADLKAALQCRNRANQDPEHCVVAQAGVRATGSTFSVGSQSATVIGLFRDEYKMDMAGRRLVHDFDDTSPDEPFIQTEARLGLPKTVVLTLIP